MPIIKVNPREALEYVKNFDWSTSDALTDEDIARQAADDPDVAPVPTDGDADRLTAKVRRKAS